MCNGLGPAGRDDDVNRLPDGQQVAGRMVLNGGGALITVSAVTADTARRQRRERGPVRGTGLMSTGV